MVRAGETIRVPVSFEVSIAHGEWGEGPRVAKGARVSPVILFHLPPLFGPQLVAQSCAGNQARVRMEEGPP